MRLTVGPLPPAVYWRRRAVVLGAMLLVVLTFYAACGGSGSADRKGAADGTPTVSPEDLVPTGPDPTETLLVPESGDPGEPGGGGGPGGPSGGDPEPTGGAPTEAGFPPQAPAGVDPLCTDQELTVTPLPAKTTISKGSPVDIRLRIKNSGDRSCRRDVGADEQELRIVQGAQTIWSSDNCGAQRGSEVREIGPGRTLEYGVTWNGKHSDRCKAGVPSGAAADSGEYQVIARLGTKHSAPVTLVIR